MWLLWNARTRLAFAQVKALPAALLLLVPCGVAAFFFWRSGLPGLQLLMLPLVILVAVLAAFGASVMRIVAVPVAFLYFAAPAWNLILSPPLRALTIRVIAILAPAVGLPATLTGAYIGFPNGVTFEVTPECSGASFLVQGLAIAALLGELEQSRLGRRLRLMGAMAIVALLTNWIRVLLIIQLGYSTNMQSPLATRDHVAFGYLLFVAAISVYVWIATRTPLPSRSNPIESDHTAIWRPRTTYALSVLTLAATPALLTYALSTTTTPFARTQMREAAISGHSRQIASLGARCAGSFVRPSGAIGRFHSGRPPMQSAVRRA